MSGDHFKIEELAREAGFKHPDHVGLCEEYAYFDHMKFAELIVRECVEVVRQHNFHKRTQIAILEHFGIKE